jgi:hypothetical protein
MRGQPRGDRKQNVVVRRTPRTPAGPPIPRSTSSSSDPAPVAADPSWIGACSAVGDAPRRASSLVILHDIVSYAGRFIEVASTAAGATTVNVYLNCDQDESIVWTCAGLELIGE